MINHTPTQRAAQHPLAAASAILLSLGLAACTGSSNYWIAYSPARGAAVGASYRSAVLVLTDMGKTIETTDADNGIVITAWEAGRGFGASQLRIKYRVSVDGDAFDIAAACENHHDDPIDGSVWERCDDTKRPRWVVEELASIAAALQ